MKALPAHKIGRSPVISIFAAPLISQWGFRGGRYFALLMAIGCAFFMLLMLKTQKSPIIYF